MQPFVAATSAVLACLTLVVFAAQTAAGQTVYRCGPAGNQYSAQPCADGRPVDVSDRRSAEQLADARNGVAAQRRLALAMARERGEKQRAGPPAQAGAIGPLPATAAAPGDATAPKRTASRKPTAKKAKASADDKDFVAIVPGSGQAKKKKPQP